MQQREEIEDKVFDLIVVGGGAAGLMAAGTAARDGKRVLLIEKMEKTARKVNITGKGRCNLTNMCEPGEFLAKVHGGSPGCDSPVDFGLEEAVSQPPSFKVAARSSLAAVAARRVADALTPTPPEVAETSSSPAGGCLSGGGGRQTSEMSENKTLDSQLSGGAQFFAPSLGFFGVGGLCHFFKKQGVKLEVEQGRRVFPAGGKAFEISDALRYWCADHDVVVMLNTKVEEILVAGGRVYGVGYTNKRGFRRKAEGRAVLVATGGASYPATGSEGDGYGLAHRVGHTIVPVRPSLVALRSSHPKFAELNGLRLKNVKVFLLIDGESIAEEFGETEFSPRGLDGAAILRLSRRAVDAVIEGRKVEVVLDLKSALSEEVLRDRIAREVEQLDPQAFAIDLLRKMLPRGLVYFVANEADMNPKAWVSKLTEEEIARLIGAMKRVVFPIADYGPWEQAIVTAGGVSLDEVDPATLQSRLVKGLYFAGEVLDLDADTGGYNLQIAFSTGRLAAQLK